ncbi:hypothetical protein FYL58_16020 [Klebsiella aerogenes]|nr:hypothetical protein [Klebsiella aerogenes]EIW9499056.1 hypothetical protein [Klebsiella aerogenes]
MVKTAKGPFFTISTSALAKKETVEKFFENRACQRLRTPYNAPPLTRNNGKQAAGSAGFQQ